MPKAKRGQKTAGAYAGLLNGAKGKRKSHAKALRKSKGVTAAVAYLRKTKPKKKSK